MRIINYSHLVYNDYLLVYKLKYVVKMIDNSEEKVYAAIIQE